MFRLPSLDDYSSRKEWENDCWRKLLNSKSFLGSLATAYERHNLVMRAAVREGVRSGKRFRQLAKETGLSFQTVSSIKKTLDEKSYRSYRERGKTERNKKTYSSPKTVSKPRPRGRPVRTKYGTIYLP